MTRMKQDNMKSVQPNKKVLEALRQSRKDEKNEKLIKYKNVEDLIADI